MQTQKSNNNSTYSISAEDMMECQILKGRIPILEKENEELKRIGRDYVRTLLDQLNTLVIKEKHNRAIWLRQYNLDAHSKDKKRRNRIKALIRKLDYDTLTFTEEQKAEIGFYLYCDYLREMDRKIKAISKKVDCECYFFNDWRESEVLYLFGNAPNLKCLEEAYNSNLNYLKERVLTLTKNKS